MVNGAAWGQPELPFGTTEASEPTEGVPSVASTAALVAEPESAARERGSPSPVQSATPTERVIAADELDGLSRLAAVEHDAPSPEVVKLRRQVEQLTRARDIAEQRLADHKAANAAERW